MNLSEKVRKKQAHESEGTTYIQSYRARDGTTVEGKLRGTPDITQLEAVRRLYVDGDINIAQFEEYIDRNPGILQGELLYDHHTPVEEALSRSLNDG